MRQVAVELFDPVREGRLQAVQREIATCTRCVEAGYIPAANPIFRGGSAHRRMIVGQAPGPRADRSGVPWSGASGTLLRRWLAMAGYDPDRFLDDWYFTSLTKCFPGKAKGGAGDRAPSARERALCRCHLDAEIDLVRPRLVMTLGRMAADALIPGARTMSLGELVRSTHRVDLGYGPVAIVALPHPSGVGRWLNDAGNRALVEQAMGRLAALRAELDV
jgi:uracil-DNA glycosylase